MPGQGLELEEVLVQMKGVHWVVQLACTVTGLVEYEEEERQMVVAARPPFYGL